MVTPQEDFEQGPITEEIDHDDLEALGEEPQYDSFGTEVHGEDRDFLSSDEGDEGGDEYGSDDGSDVEAQDSYWDTSVEETPQYQPSPSYAPPPPPQPSSPQIDQQAVYQLWQQNQQLQAQQIVQQVNQHVQQQAQVEYQRLVDQEGWVPEQAAQHIGMAAQAYQQQVLNAIGQRHQQNQQLSAQNQQGRINAANYYGQYYGVAPHELMAYESPTSMQHAAYLIGHARREAQYHQYQVEQYRRRRVPAQHYNQPSGAAATSSAHQMYDRYIAGDRSPQVVKAVERLMGMGS
jgi:hypothetical protein